MRASGQSELSNLPPASDTEDLPTRGPRRFTVQGHPCGQSDGAPECLEAQMLRAWNNLFDAIRAAGYEKRHLVKTTVSVTEGGNLNLYRAIRDRMMQGHVAASAYLHVAALGAPAHLVEIEAEVLK